MNVKLHVYNAFCDDDGEFGNPVGVVFDFDSLLSNEARQELAAKSGFSECVFVNDLEKRSINTFTPQNEIPFAGHATVGTAYAISDIYDVPMIDLNGVDGSIPVWEENGVVWVRSDLSATPPWWHERVVSREALEALDGPQSANQVHAQLWAWIDETSGSIRSRTFAPGWGIPEDEANGSGCMRLSAALGREIKVLHGKGSLIFAKQSEPGSADVGGRVARRPPVIINL